VCVIEQLNSNDAFIWRWAEPWKYQAREIVMPEVDKIQDGIPTKLRLKFYKTDSFYENWRGSRLYLRGVNEDRGESARGTFAHGITADEKGSWKDPVYIVNEVLLPQLLTTNGVLHTISTPPKDLGHRWYADKAQALQEGRFIQLTIDQVSYISASQRTEMCTAVGGPQSPAWRREFLCEPVADPESLVIPEFDEALDVVDDSYPRPPFFDAYVGADLGFHDNTGLLFGYYDFVQATLVIQRELWVKAKNSKEIVEAARPIEQQLWQHQAPYLRTSDNELQQLYDMATLCDYAMLPTAKDDKEAAINALRLRFKARKIKIHKSCVNLIFQLKVGMWDETRRKFLRGEGIGHLDLIDALIYLNRNVNTHRNPYPQEAINLSTHFVPPEYNSNSSPEADMLKSMFPFVQIE